MPKRQHRQIFWTVGTRDFRTLMAERFASPEGAGRYRDREHLDGWIVIQVDHSKPGRVYSSPELPGGPVAMPAAGTF